MILYIEINFWLALTWISFRLIPWRKTSFRSIRQVAQLMLLLSVVAPLILKVLPDNIFPKLKLPAVQVLKANALAETAPLTVRSQPIDLDQKPSSGETIQSKMPSPWVVLFELGFLIVTLKWTLQVYRLWALLRSTMVLHRIGRVRVSFVDLLSVPFSVVTPRWAHVVLPMELASSRLNLKIALRHEIEHHRRRDTTWAQAIEIFICVFYLNPAIYAWKKTILELQELACDEALIGRMGISAHAYGSCLIKVAEMALANRFMCAGTTCMNADGENNSRSFLRRRIEMLAHHQRSQRRHVTIAIGIFVSLFIFIGAYAAQAALRSGGASNPGQPVFDANVQSLATQCLRSSLTNLKAGAGFILVSDVQSGRLLAAASLNESFDSSLKGDWALSYPMAPASGLKSIVTAAAIDKGVTTPNEIHNGENGIYQYGVHVQRDVNPFRNLSTTDVVVHSSNIGIIKVATKLGSSGLEKALEEFGFGKDGSTKDFPAARPGFIPPASSLSTESYITSVALGSSDQAEFFVSPLEMVAAYGAIANGGRLMKPMNANEIHPTFIRQVISTETSNQMRQILRRAVTEGTGQTIRESKIHLAGKTSTYELPGNKRVGGFIGFAPAENPKIVVYVAIFDPKSNAGYGAQTAAPVFRELVEKILR